MMSATNIIVDLDLSMVPTVPLWRPDSVEVLRDRDAIIRFNRYWRILAGKALPKFLICKKIEVEPYNETDEDAMWSSHSVAMAELKAVSYTHLTLPTTERV